MTIRCISNAIFLIIVYSSNGWAQDDPHLAENAPRDCPAMMSNEVLRDIVNQNAPVAMQEWSNVRDRFLSGLPEQESLFVTVLMGAENGPVEYAFVAIDSIEGEEIKGRIWSEIMMFPDIKHGDPIVLTTEEISDWLIISKPDGSEEGNIIGLELERVGQCAAEN